METLLYIPPPTELAQIAKQLKKVPFVMVEGTRFERFRKETIQRAKRGEMDLPQRYSHMVQKGDHVLCWCDGRLEVKKVMAVNQVNYLLKIQIDVRKWVGKNKIVARVYRPIPRV